MKTKLLFILSLLVALNSTNVQAQNMEDKLEAKYGFACEHTSDGQKWYSVKKDGMEGACDKNGKEILAPAFDNVHVYYDDKYIKTVKDKKVSIYSLSGKLIISTPYEDVRWWQMKDEPYCSVILNGKVGLMDKNGDSVIPCEFDGINTYNIDKTGICEVTLNDKKGVYDVKNHKLLIPCLYDYISYYNLNKKGFVRVLLDNKSGIYGADGKEWIPCNYSYVDNDDETTNYFILAKGGQRPTDASPLSDTFLRPQNAKWGVVDKNNKEAVPFEYDWISYIFNDIAFVKNGGNIVYSRSGSYKDYKIGVQFIRYSSKFEGGKLGFYNIKTGKKSDCLYNEGKYGEGYICCQNQFGKWGYLDAATMDIAIPFEYDKAVPFAKGVAQVQKDGKATFLTDPKKGTALTLANGGNSIKVDSNIPLNDKKQEESFAFIIANENYTHLKGADYAINDGKVFKDYCLKTFGIPESNVRYFEDATYGNMANAVKKIKDIADVYEGDANIIVYFSGLGATDAHKERYLLPTDATLATLNVTGYNLQRLLDELNELNTRQTIVILDAPFSGLNKEGKTLSENRGVAIVPKPTIPQGNTVLITGCSGSETAYSLKDYGHSLFTYGLLDKIQDSKGKCTLKEAVDHATSWVKRESFKRFNKVQNPQIQVSESTKSNLNNIKF